MVRHTSLVERYIPVIANCIVDTDDIVRIHSLSIISKLVLVFIGILSFCIGRLC